MKTVMKLAKLVASLPEAVQEGVAAAIKEAGLDGVDLDLKRASSANPALTSDDERAALQYVSTRDVDRDGEILVPAGALLSEFRKAPQVLWGHNYTEPPIGSDEFIQTDERGLLAKTRYASTDRAREVWTLKKEGHLKTSSVGFVGLDSIGQEHGEFGKTMDKLRGTWPELKRTADRVLKITRKWLLLEHSDVSVPANPNALVMAVSKGDLLISEDMAKELAVDGQLKRAIPFAVHGDGPTADADAEWDGPRQIREAEIDDLRIMATWVDSENPDIKGSYKLPHHQAAGNHPVVFRGVAAAMGALLGARGGVDIPSADRRPVYNHLARHYRQFDREPPEFRDYGEAELKRMFPDEAGTLNAPAMVARPSVVLVSGPTPETEVEKIEKNVREAIDLELGMV